MKKKITAITVITLLILISQRPEITTFSAVIIDPLSPKDNDPHQLYDLLVEAGYEVSYIQSQEAKVSTFTSIPPDTDLLILRVHSSIEDRKIWIFSAEPYTNNKYQVEQLLDHLHRAKTSPEEEYLFALGSTYFLDHLTLLEDTVVLVLGCDAAASRDLADVFITKGAACYVGWDGPVSLTHTDLVFIEVVKHLINGQGIKDAMIASLKQLGNDPHYNSTLLCIK